MYKQFILIILLFIYLLSCLKINIFTHLIMLLSNFFIYKMNPNLGIILFFIMFIFTLINKDKYLNIKEKYQTNKNNKNKKLNSNIADEIKNSLKNVNNIDELIENKKKFIKEIEEQIQNKYKNINKDILKETFSNDSLKRNKTLKNDSLKINKNSKKQNIYSEKEYVKKIKDLEKTINNYKTLDFTKKNNIDKLLNLDTLVENFSNEMYDIIDDVIELHSNNDTKKDKKENKNLLSIFNHFLIVFQKYVKILIQKKRIFYVGILFILLSFIFNFVSITK